MDNAVCIICNITVSKANSVYSLDKNFTVHTNTLLRTFIGNILRQVILETTDLNVCSDCFQLLNELDFAEKTSSDIRQKLYCYLQSYNCNSVSVYCQTDILPENILMYDVRGNIRFKSEASVSECVEDNKEHTSAKPYECHICFKKFISKNGASIHVKKQHPEISPDESKQEIKLESDMESEELVAAVYSDENDEGTSKKKRGRKKKNPDVPKPYHCPLCSKTWRTLGELKSHLASHNNAISYICEICGQTYKHKSGLDVHVGMHNGINPFICDYCGKSFTQKGALQRHLPIHTGETPYQCDLCGKRFVHHTSFNIHRLSHSGQKDYICGTCGLALLSGSHLKRHMRVHTGERKYACTVCGKRFAERYNLASHQKLHENPGTSKLSKKSHRCQICGSSYERRLKLEEHLKNDHQKMVGDADIQTIFIKNEGQHWAMQGTKTDAQS